uniref:DUF1293 family protein n=1 Tax=Pseudoalteromonas sp. BSi20327 TaxID=383749 RepID=UPI0015CF6D84|nr:DUF1293 family protein [Pseudoalteromonas sp. BSi20327]
MAITIAGIGITKFPESKNPDAERAVLLVLYPFDDVDAPKFKREAYGFTTEVPFNKEPLAINIDYARKIGKSGAFVGKKDYDLKFHFNEQIMENEVVEIIPVDPELKRHFKESLGG